MDMYQDAPLSLVFGKAGLTAGTTTTYTIANTIAFAIKSKLYSKASGSNSATPTTDKNTGAAFVAIQPNNGAVFVWLLDASGNVSVAQGQTQALDAGGAFVELPNFPPIPDTTTPFAYLTVLAGATASAWTLGSSNLAGPPTGITLNFQDIATLPPRLQAS